MTHNRSLALGTALLIFCLVGPAPAQNAPAASELRIDVPVQLRPSRVVFNMDHLAFAADQSIGLNYMRLMLQNYRASSTPIEIIAVFHGAAGYMLLNDEAYNRNRRTDRGNPYEEIIAGLQRDGVRFEECGQTARTNSWGNADLLAGVKVNSGANLRLVQLQQDGWVQIQP
jgi:intracellular sulfur oxidation DsrE/DsrF family protein